MKRIFIVRHAKSSWEDPSLSDWERPLNKRGHRDALMMAAWCKNLDYIPEVMISSDAMRAKSTAGIFSIEFFGNDDDLILESSLYHAPAETYFEQCYGLDDNVKSVMMFGHNPGITYLANMVSGDFIDNVPTCGVLVLDMDVKKWQNADPRHCELVDFLYPKMRK